MIPENLQSKTVRALLEVMVASTGLELQFTVTDTMKALSPDHFAVGGVADKRLSVEFTGADTHLLTARNGELLNAMEHIAAKVIGLEETDHDRIIFDADLFKADRNREMRLLAETAIESVRSTGKPYAFRPMTSHERRQLHLLLSESGLKTASSGETPRRFVMLYPEGYDPEQHQPVYGAMNGGKDSREGSAVPVSDRVQALRNSFRRR